MAKRFYIASKTCHAKKWIALRASGEPIISTWIDDAEKVSTTDLQDLWRRCVQEASTATALILYIEPGDVLKGAFVEVGCALAHGIPVFIVGKSPGSFPHHPLVTECMSLLDALNRAHSEIKCF